MEETTGTALGYLWLFAIVGGPIILGAIMAVGVRRSRLRGRQQQDAKGGQGGL